MRLQAGDIVGSYQIISHIGQGGMATVFQAHHQRLDRHVAIKLMHETFLQDEDFRARFQREARIVAKLDHPNIVPVFDYNEHEGVPYLVMKYIPGMTLKRRAIVSGITLEEARDILTDVANGLDYAHKQGILHRDMKPSNILIDDNGTPYLTDFGLARIAAAGSSTISADVMLGTPYYISPEQAQGEKNLDSRTDIYSLGVILYELITGRVPFEGDTAYAIVHGHIYSVAKAPTELNSDLPAAVDDVIDRALAKNPEERYPTARALMDDFAAAIAERPPKPAAQAKQPKTENTAEAVKPQPVRPPLPPPPPVPGKPRQSDFQLDMGDIDFSQIGERIRTGVNSFAEMIEERIDTELRQRRGVALTEEEIVRRKVAKRMKARQDFINHLTSYLTVNAVLVGIWYFTGAGFFWPMFPLFFWGLGVVGQGVQYYSRYGPGAERVEAQFEEEVRREMSRGGTSAETRLGEKPKGKRGGLSLEEMDAGAGQVRLNDEGELTDSFIDEQRRRR